MEAVRAKAAALGASAGWIISIGITDIVAHEITNISEFLT